MAQQVRVLNALIEEARITNDDHGLLSSWLSLKLEGGFCQGFGGYALYLPQSFTHHRLLSHAGHWIWRVMEVAGARKWSELKGKTIRVRKPDDFGPITAIGHIIDDDWFDPSVDFKTEKAA